MAWMFCPMLMPTEPATPISTPTARPHEGSALQTTARSKGASASSQDDSLDNNDPLTSIGVLDTLGMPPKIGRALASTSARTRVEPSQAPQVHHTRERRPGPQKRQERESWMGAACTHRKGIRRRIQQDAIFPTRVAIPQSTGESFVVVGPLSCGILYH